MKIERMRQYMRSNDNDTIGQTLADIGARAMEDAGIIYRMVPYKNGGGLFFCCQDDDASFDMSIEPNGEVRLWQFVRQGMPEEKIGKKIIFSTKYKDPDVQMGLEITEDEILNFWYKRSLDTEDNTEQQILEAMEAFFDHLQELEDVLPAGTETDY